MWMGSDFNLMATHPLGMSMPLLDLWYYVTKQAKDKNALIDRMIK